jgi:hypothetical protein
MQSPLQPVSLPAALSAAAPGVTTYAAAAKALTTSAHPVPHRIALCRTLLAHAHSLAPHPAPLVLSHAIYALTVSGDCREDYWPVAATAHIASGAPLPASVATAAANALRAGKDSRPGERYAAARALAVIPPIRAPLEVRAQLAAAACVAVADGEGDEGERAEIRTLAVRLMREYEDAQTRCANPKRVLAAVLQSMISDVVALPETEPKLTAVAMATVQAGIFASPTGVLESNSHYASLYTWVAKIADDARLSHALSAILRGCVSASQNIGLESIAGSASAVAEAAALGVGGKRKQAILYDEHDPKQSLPRSILVPLVFFKDMVRCLCARLHAAKEFGNTTKQTATLRALASFLATASALGIYRPSYDSTLAVASKKAKLVAKTSKKAMGDTPSAPLSFDTNRERGANDNISVGSDIASIFQNVASLLLTLQHSDESTFSILLAGCDTLHQALRLSLDAVTSEIPSLLVVLATHAALASSSQTTVESLSSVMCALINTHAASRQLPVLFAHLVAGGCPQIGRLSNVWQTVDVRDAIVQAVKVAPRGQADLIIRSMANLMPSDTTGSTLKSGNDHELRHGISQVVLLSSLVLESAPAIEHPSLALAFERAFVPALVKAVGPESKRSSRDALFLRASILFVMASTGVPLTSPLFRNSLFRDGKAERVIYSEDYSSPDSDSSGYESAERAKQERLARSAPVPRFRQALALGAAWKPIKTRRSSMSAKLASPGRNEVVDKKRPAALLLVHLRYLASLAQVCASDVNLSGDEIDDPLQVALSEAWLLFEQLDVPAVLGALSSLESPTGEMHVFGKGENDALSFARLGSSLVGLTMKSGSSSISVNVEDIDSLTTRGFISFVQLALVADSSFDAVWEDLWESPLIRGVLVRTMCKLVNQNGDYSQSAICSALERCASVPTRYLSDSDDLKLASLCISAVKAVSADGNMINHAAMRLLALRRRVGNDAFSSKAVWMKAAVGLSGTESIVQVLALPCQSCETENGKRDTQAKRSLKARGRLADIAVNAGLPSMAWFVRGATDSSRDTTTGIVTVVSALERSVLEALDGRHIGEKDVAFLAIRDVVRLVQSLPINSTANKAAAVVKQDGGSGSSPALNLDEQAERVQKDRGVLRGVMSRLIRYALPQCCACDSSGGCAASNAAIKLLCEICVGWQPPYRVVFCSDSDGMTADSTAIHIAATALSWASLPSSSENGRAVLATLVSTDPSARTRAIRDALSQCVLQALNRSQVNFVGPARVLLAEGKHIQRGRADADIAVGALRAAVAAMGGWGWFAADTADTTNQDLSEDGSAHDEMARVRVVTDAVCAAEGWARHCGGKAAQSVACEIVQLLVRVVSVSRVQAYSSATVSIRALCICDVLIKQQHAATDGEISTGALLWGVQRAGVCILSHVSSVSGAVCTALGRVHESVSACSGAAASVVCAAMLGDLSRGLAGVRSGDARRAAAQGAAALVAAVGDDGVAKVMSALETDQAKDVLRALRAEVVGELRYRGRA